jgi:hypothetical protein
MRIWNSARSACDSKLQAVTEKGASISDSTSGDLEVFGRLSLPRRWNANTKRCIDRSSLSPVMLEPYGHAHEIARVPAFPTPLPEQSPTYSHEHESAEIFPSVSSPLGSSGRTQSSE